MVKNYFLKSIKKERQYIYLKKGRFIIIIIAIFFSLLTSINKHFLSDELNKLSKIGYQMISNIPNFIFEMYFMLYLIPYLFKNNEYKRFWIHFTLALTLSIAIEISINGYYYYIGLVDESTFNFTKIIYYTFVFQINNILGITSIFFLFEIFEEISLRKKSQLDARITREVERKLKGTHTELPYMTQAIRAIKNNLAHYHDTKTAQTAILTFSEILRYKLYGYDTHFVSLHEEMNILQQSINLYNVIITNPNYQCNIDYQVNNTQDYLIEKQLLINTIYPFIKNSEDPKFSEIIIYILQEKHELNIAITANYSTTFDLELAKRKIMDNLINKYQDINFEEEPNNQSLTINICLNLQPKFNV